MRMLFKTLALLAVTTLCSFPALAYENLIGEYEGKFKGENDYGKQEGDSCTVKIGKSDRYSGGSVSFAVSGVDEIHFDVRSVSDALAAGGHEVKLGARTAAHSGQDREIVYLKLREDGAVAFIKLTRKPPRQHIERSISCGDLTKK